MTVAGVVIHRQRPGTAKAVSLVRKSPALVIEGRLEFHDGVTNIVARSFETIGVQTVQSRDFR